jgi:hypothetical protein
LALYKGKPVVIQGEPLYEITYSDAILIRLLEAYDPEREAGAFQRNDLKYFVSLTEQRFSLPD